MLRRVVPCLCALLLVAPALATISTATVTLDYSSAYAHQAYGKVVVTADSTAGTVRFQVTPFNVQPLYGYTSGFGIEKFAFNYNTTLVTAAPSTWTVTNPSGWSSNRSNPTVATYGNFAMLDSGNSSNRKNPLDFTIKLPTSKRAQAIASSFITPNAAGYTFAAYVAGFTGPRCSGNHWIFSKPPGSPVPVPAGAALGALGLGLSGLLRRRMFA
jgi:MYXO-CTERM domain-containing protein